MGYPGGAGRREVKEVVEGAIKKISSSGRTAGTLAGTDAVGRYIDFGARFFSFSYLPWLAEGAEKFHETVTKATK
jgi:2-keto-3-deoxy-L-rhamnonate aldolase RhmA